MIHQHVTWGALAAAAAIGGCLLPSAAVAQQETDGTYQAASSGTRWLEGNNGFSIKMLVEGSNLGGREVEIGEITFPVGSGQSRRGHTHGAVEIFYILSGRLDHIVNDTSHVLEPGMVGIVRPGDTVVHRVVSDVPVKALVIWAPGGEADRIAGDFRQRPVERR